MPVHSSPVHDTRGYTFNTEIDLLYPASGFLDGLSVEANIRKKTFQTLGFKLSFNQMEN